ncbi:MAG: Type polyketide synthase 5 [Glaciihabitans sp.]|nr:Type polyketide synthase 5 [Glaciihabitans sp.]
MQAETSPAAPVAAEMAVAVIGMACRFPGAEDLPGFWRLLVSGADAIGPATADRSDRRPGGYLAAVDMFDAEFFGIPAREAAAMDPQQRLLLELCWHALEDAGIAPRGPARPGRTGVYVGCCSDDYALMSRLSGIVDPYTMTGTGRAFLANRISHEFEFSGPSVVVDTGQSSSLVALHQAIGGFVRGECAKAVVAGVQLNLTEVGDHILAELGALSPQGRCRPFDARADGIARGEGAGVVVIKPLEAAIADGDRVYCTVLATALNNDGGGSRGLTAPSRGAQRDLLLDAYERAGVGPEQVQYVELHGTGTPVGDPVEAGALGDVFASGRAGDRPLLVGSVKTNIGHLEGAAGIAGLIKTAASLYHRELPPTLNHLEPNPAIDLDMLRLRVCTERQAWPEPQRPLFAGVSSFGLGGTNCHVVLGEPPRRAPATGEDRPVPVLLSARDEPALREQAARFAEHLAFGGTARLVDIGAASAARASLRHRAAVVASHTDELVARLCALAAGTPLAAGVIEGAGRQGSTGYLFAGDGKQRLGMGRRLHKEFEAFATAFDEACAAAEHVLGTSIRDAAWVHQDLLDRMAYAQPALLALEIGLYRLLESWGIVPDVVIGHSQGEIAAAHVAGMLSTADAALLAAHRGRLSDALGLGATTVAVRDELCDIATGLTWHRPTGPVLVSTVTGKPVHDTQTLTPEYWARQLGAPVRFRPAVQTAHELGARFFVEIGPGRGLSTSAAEAVGPGGGLFAAPLSGEDELIGVAEIAGLAFVSDRSVDWPAVYGSLPVRVALPLTVFRRKRYWLDPPLPSRSPVPESSGPAWSGDLESLVMDSAEAVFGEVLDGDHDLDRTFTDIGLDSRMTVALRTMLAKATGRVLPTTLLYEYPTPAKLIEALQSDSPL